MYHIVPSANSKFRVVLVAENGEVLSTTQPLSSKQKAWGNIRSQLICSCGEADVQDDTAKTLDVIMYHFSGKKMRYVEPWSVPKYVPGKNKIKKK